MDNLVPALSQSLFMNTTDVFAEFLENTIDSFIDDELLNNIPIFNTVLSVCKTGYCLRERNLMKQTLAFLVGINDGSLTEEQISHYRTKILKNETRVYKELQRVLVILDQEVDTRHSLIMGIFFRAFLGEEISLDVFRELEEINRRMFSSDYDALFTFEPDSAQDEKDYYKLDRLASLGLLQPVRGGQAWRNVSNGTKKYELSPMGTLFCNHAKDTSAKNSTVQENSLS